MTTLECIFRESSFGVAVELEAEENPATGDTCWLCDAAAAIGTEKKDTYREEDALRKIEANTLATCVGLACGSGLAAGVRDGDVGSGMRSCDTRSSTAQKGALRREIK